MIQNKKLKEKRNIVVYKYDLKSLVAIACLRTYNNAITQKLKIAILPLP